MDSVNKMRSSSGDAAKFYVEEAPYDKEIKSVAIKEV